MDDPAGTTTDIPQQELVPPIPQEPATTPPKSRLKSELREFVETLALALVIFLFLRTVVVMNYRVIGHSMLPNIQEGQFFLIDKLFFDWGAPQRGDVVVLEPPDVPDQIYIKRIIGLPGETLEVRDGQVYIDDQPLTEPWATKPAPGTSWGPGMVGPDEVFVMGDNRPGSRDSRYFGMLPLDEVIGRAFLCYWPPNAWRILPRYKPADFG